MGECWNIPDARILSQMDDQLLEERQVRALANYFRTFHGADSFVTALDRVRALTQAAEPASTAIWNQIAEEISQMETSDILQRCLSRPAEGKSSEQAAPPVVDPLV
jgi:hypothetical protein